jgi:hypothetical protein
VREWYDFGTLEGLAVNKIVLEHYPVSQLPHDLREQIRGVEKVTLTIEAEEQTNGEPAQLKGIGDWYAKYKHVRRQNYKTTEEVNDWVRSLRDEWSHRER